MVLITGRGWLWGASRVCGAQHLDTARCSAPGCEVGVCTLTRLHSHPVFLAASKHICDYLASMYTGKYLVSSVKISLIVLHTFLHQLTLTVAKVGKFSFHELRLRANKGPPFSLRMLSDIFSSGSVSPPCSLVFTYTRPDVDDRSASWSWFSGKQTVESSVTGVVILNFVIYLSCLWE